MRSNATADPARLFLDRLEDEHDDVLRLLHVVLDKGPSLARDKDLRALCWAVRTHLRGELEVFVPAMAIKLTGAPILNNMKRVAEATLTVVDLVEHEKQANLRKAIVRLGTLFMGHVIISEQMRGVHDVAWSLPLDWHSLDARYLRSRQEFAQSPLPYRRDLAATGIGG